jgi:hypothetical protein
MMAGAFTGVETLECKDEIRIRFGRNGVWTDGAKTVRSANSAFGKTVTINFLPSQEFTTQMSGYSGTPLAKKLGIKSGFRVKTKNAPPAYQNLLRPIPDDVSFSANFRSDIDLWHLFTSSRKELAQQLATAQKQIRPDGMIWVSWPKKASGVPSEVTEDTIREIALPMGLVDVKVCAVDDTWSGLKLMIRKEFRR